MSSSTIIPIITTLIVLWVITAALKEFALRRKEKIKASAFKDEPADAQQEAPTQKASAAARPLNAASIPFQLLSRGWSKLLFELMADNCLLFTLITALLLLALLCAAAAGAMMAPGLVYSAWSNGDTGSVLLCLALWLLCLIALPAMLSGIKDAYRGEYRGPAPVRLRLLLILAGIGIVLIPVSLRCWPGLFFSDNAAFGRGAVVHLRTGAEEGGVRAVKPDSQPAENNLLKNGDFEKLRGNKLLGWETDIYGDKPETVRFTVVEGGAFSGDNYVIVENLEANDSKLVQRVKLKPRALYKISCMVKAEGVGKQGKGANITVLNIFKTSRQVKDTAGKWEKLVFYGKSGPYGEEVAVTARLGGYGAVSTGKAAFDDFRVEEVTSLPEGTKATQLYKIMPGHRQPPGLPIMHTFMYSSMFLFLVLFLISYYFIFKNKTYELPAVKFNYLELTFFIVLTASFVLRLLLAPVIEGFSTDVNTFKAWAGMAAHRGLTNFYSGEMHVDYPPGYIYILYLIGLLKKLFSLAFESKSYLVLIKLPAMIADMLTALIIYKVAKRAVLPAVNRFAPGNAGGGGKEGYGVFAAGVLSLFYALNPAVILNSAVWGQVDSFFTLFILLALLFLYKDKFEAAAVIFVLALLIKPQALIFTPVFIYAFIKKRSIKVFLRSFFLMIATFVILILPFAVNRPLLWIFDLYKTTLSSYPFACLNAFNLFALTGGNYAKDTETFFIFSYRIWGYVFIAAIVMFSAFLFFKSKNKNKDKDIDRTKIFFIAMFIISAVFILSSRMHERYLFPVLCLSLISYVFTGDKRLLFVFAGFTLTHFVNTALVLDSVVRLGVDRFPHANILLYLISFINLALLVYTVQTGVDIYLNRTQDKLT
jgi:Gpi18-like mannosyltransferase